MKIISRPGLTLHRLRIGVGCLCLAMTGSVSSAFITTPQDPDLPSPILLEKQACDAGNPLATYAAMLDREPEYLASPIFGRIFPQMRLNFEQFLGLPLSGEQAMSLPELSSPHNQSPKPLPESFVPEAAIEVVAREARNTRVVIWAEEHHLPQTRSLNEALLGRLWDQGYRYFAAEAFADSVMDPHFEYPDYRSGYYLRDPVFAASVRAALALGYTLVAYDTMEQGPPGFRDRTQAENLKSRIFDVDPDAKAFIVAGRGHAVESVEGWSNAGGDGWTPMATVLKAITGIDPLTVFAPTMSQRRTRGEEHPHYQFATAAGLVEQPTIFVHATDGRLLGSPPGFDAYVFWPRVTVVHGRPDWMTGTMDRRSTPIPEPLRAEQGLRLVQAFEPGQSVATIPVDQVLIEGTGEGIALMLPPGEFMLRSVDRASRVIAEATVTVR